MTTKPKTRKPAQKSRVSENFYVDDRFPIENRYDRNFTSNDISKLIARWRFLEADRQYHAAIAPPELAKCAFLRHAEEQAKIMEKLSCTVPDSFEDVNALMKFSIERVMVTLGTFGSSDKSIVRMLKTVSAGIFNSEAKVRVDSVIENMRRRCEERISEI